MNAFLGERHRILIVVDRDGLPVDLEDHDRLLRFRFRRLRRRRSFLRFLSGRSVIGSFRAEVFQFRRLFLIRRLVDTGGQGSILVARVQVFLPGSLEILECVFRWFLCYFRFVCHAVSLRMNVLRLRIARPVDAVPPCGWPSTGKQKAPRPAAVEPSHTVFGVTSSVAFVPRTRPSCRRPTARTPGPPASSRAGFPSPDHSAAAREAMQTAGRATGRSGLEAVGVRPAGRDPEKRRVRLSLRQASSCHHTALPIIMGGPCGTGCASIGGICCCGGGCCAPGCCSAICRCNT